MECQVLDQEGICIYITLHSSFYTWGSQFSFNLPWTSQSPPLPLLQTMNATNYFIKRLLHKTQNASRAYSFQKTEELQWQGGNVEMLSREGTSRHAGSRGMVLRLLAPQPTTLKAVNDIIFK